MIGFTFKFIISMFHSCFKEICLVLLGMVLCLSLLINYGDSLFTIENEYDNVSDDEAVMYAQNCIYFTFSDVERMDEIVRQVKALPGVYGVYMEGNVGVDIRCGTRLPLLKRKELLTGSIPKELSEGQIITSHDLLMDDDSDIDDIIENSPDGELVILEGDMKETTGREFVAKGEKVFVGGKDFINVAEVSGSEGHIVTVEDFIKLYKEKGQGGICLSYIYEKGFSGQQKEEIEKVITAIRQPEDTFISFYAGDVDFSDFTTESQSEFLGLVIASLNALFLYAYLLKKRIPIYTILKLQGLTNVRLRGMLLMEFLVIYLVACLLSGAVYVGFATMTGRQMVYTKSVYLYSIVSMFVINVILFLIITWKLAKKQPFELYQKKE